MSEHRSREHRPGRSSSAERAARYTRIKTVGKGSYGTVDLVKRRDNNKLYVMKRVKYSVSNEKEHRSALREVQFLKMLKHPNIVDFGEAFLTPQRSHLCIVMGYCEGGDLINRIRDARERGRYMPEDDIMEWFVQMCMALAYLHDRKILHRDIKPHNVFLTNHGRVVKVGDFGVTRILDHTNSMAKTTIGTPYYVSPEICCSKSYNSKSDVWALGVVLYELCALAVPFDASNFSKLRVKILKTHPKPLKGPYSVELKELLRDILTKDPDTRPSVRDILKRRICQHHLRLLMKRHSKKPEEPAAVQPSAIAAQRQRRLEAKLAAKKAELAKAQEEDSKPRGVVHIEVGNQRPSNKSKQDLLVGAAGGKSEKVKALEAQVVEMEDNLAHTSVAVHEQAVAEDRNAEELHMQDNAKTLLQGDASESKLVGDEGESGDEGKRGHSSSKYEEYDEEGGKATDDDHHESSKLDDATLSSIGRELVHQMSTGKLEVDAGDLQKVVEARGSNLRVARSLHRGGPVKVNPAAVRAEHLTDDEARRVSSYGQELVRTHTSDSSSSSPAARPSSRHKKHKHRHKHGHGHGHGEARPGYGEGGRAIGSRGSSRGSSRMSDHITPRSRGTAYTEARAGSQSRASLLSHAMGPDHEMMEHNLRLSEPNQEQALLIDRLPKLRPSSAGRPITARSDFSEGLDSDLLHSVRTIEGDLPSVGRSASRAGRPTSAHRRRSDASVHLAPLH